MEGIASCRKCGNEVRAKIGIDITCSLCGRIFQIPDAPEYHLTARLQELKKVPHGAILGCINGRGENSCNGASLSVEFHFNVQPIQKGGSAQTVSTAFWGTAVWLFGNFTRDRIAEMVGFHMEGISGATEYIERLRNRLASLELLLK